MKMTYDPDVDALYIELHDVAIAKSVDLEEGVTLDYDAGGQVIGIEILDVRHRVDVEAMTTAAATGASDEVAPSRLSEASGE